MNRLLFTVLAAALLVGTGLSGRSIAAADTPNLCEGLSSEAVAQDPLLTLPILDTRSITEPQGKQRLWTPMGAAVLVPAEQGMTAAYLQRALSCHAARAEGSQSPLAVDGAQVEVRATDGAFQVTVTADRRSDAREIQRRVEALGRR
ncbi:MAG: hypothetical protein ACOCXM_08305 [Myxococcota bacterium]